MRFSPALAIISGGWASQILAAGASGDAELANDHSADPVPYGGGVATEPSICRVEATKTVFVTLQPSESDSDLPVSHGSGPRTTTVMISPVQSMTSSQASVKAFTTITIDWSAATESRVGSSNSVSASSVTTAGTALPGDHLPSTGANANSPSMSLPEYTVTDTNVQWLPDTTGVTQITVLSTHTITLAVHTVASALTDGTLLRSSTVVPLTETGLATTCQTLTILGPDGQPTVVETTIISNPSAVEESSAQASGNPVSSAILGEPTTISQLPPPAYESRAATGIPVHTTYTVLGSDGLPTTVDTTWTVPLPSGTTSMIADGTDVAGSSSNTISGMPFPNTAISTALPSSGLVKTSRALTTCTTFTVIGQDGLPTVSEATLIIPDSTQTPTDTEIAVPSFVVPPALTNLEQTRPVIATDAAFSTITVDVIGADGVVSPIVQTIIPASEATVFGIPTNPAMASSFNIPAPPQFSSPGFPGPLTQGSSGYGLPPAYGSAPAASSLLSGLGSAPPVTDVPVSESSAVPASEPPAYAYPSDFPLPPYATGGVGATTGSPPGYMTYGTDADWPSSILYGPFPTAVTPVPPVQTPLIATSLATSTWTNVIPEQTTTYTMKFPLTTMVTVTLPPAQNFGMRLMRRQDSAAPFSWTNSSTIGTITLTENTSLMSSLSSGLIGQTPSATPTPSSATITLPTTPVNTPPVSTPSIDPSICPSGSKVGNLTVNFDELPRGPLLNPAGDFWFSEGFLIAPPSSPPSNSYVPSSGGQLVEFVPPALSPVSVVDGSGDTAEIGVGPNETNPCFRFDFYGANLGCAAEGIEQWCEFEFSAYTYNETSATEMSLAWSEMKRVPACPQFPHGTCALTPVELKGYTNLSSILIKLRVGLELRAWWGDDFKLGWSDNSCEASACRTNATPRKVKRDVFDRAARRGVWQWTPTGVKKLDDDYVWASFD